MQLSASLTAKLTQAEHAPRLKLPHRLLSLDSTVIDLCAKVFDWAKYRKTRGAVKLHLLLDHEGLLPHYAVVTEGKRSGIAVARKLDLPSGSMLVFDRDYCDYAWFADLDAVGASRASSRCCASNCSSTGICGCFWTVRLRDRPEPMRKRNRPRRCWRRCMRRREAPNLNRKVALRACRSQ